jgi:hypothetical protein
MGGLPDGLRLPAYLLFCRAGRVIRRPGRQRALAALALVEAPIDDPWIVGTGKSILRRK